MTDADVMRVLTKHPLAGFQVQEMGADLTDAEMKGYVHRHGGGYLDRCPPRLQIWTITNAGRRAIAKKRT